jgi:hypothetical protein
MYCGNLQARLDGVQALIAERVRASDGHISAKRLPPIAEAAGTQRLCSRTWIAASRSCANASPV